MIVELIRETSPASGTMYVVKAEGSSVKWFAKLEEAEKFYNEIIDNPDVLKPIKDILKSQEIDVSLEKQNQ